MKRCKIEHRHEELSKTFEKCIWCDKKIGLSFNEKVDNLYQSLITDKMKIDFIKSLREGKTIGEATKESNIPKHEFQTLFTGKIIFERERYIRYLDLGDGVKVL